jgi:succinylglutamate desuccinylase
LDGKIVAPANNEDEKTLVLHYGADSFLFKSVGIELAKNRRQGQTEFEELNQITKEIKALWSSKS